MEILSPSTRSTDLVRKRHVYDRAGLAHYWIVDPEMPSVATFELIGERLTEQRVAKADETLTVDRPFTVTLTPADLFVD